ncbi:Imm45 family immunity protein [Mesorhizobium sp. IMUNJ 23033]|uniref:Imm45 family immunity protein n=1 Tax=Mesorhizobium sp. IMUNJ 23033 TaxID=3378039 RepID=UPI00385012C3
MQGEGPLFRGTLFRFRRIVPREEILYYMLFSALEGSGLGLIRECGYDAGNILVIFPMEAKLPGKGAISPAWLSRHWQEWVDSSTTADSVWVLKRGALGTRKTTG